MIRATTSSDETEMIQVAVESGLFEPDQVSELATMLQEYHRDTESAEEWLTEEASGKLISVAYFVPEKMTEGTWNLLLIAVRPNHQRHGHGQKMLTEVIRQLREREARVLLVETAGTDDFDYVRRFYQKHGFEEEARIREFYSAKVDKVIFRLSL